MSDWDFNEAHISEAEFHSLFNTEMSAWHINKAPISSSISITFEFTKVRLGFHMKLLFQKPNTRHLQIQEGQLRILILLFSKRYNFFMSYIGSNDLEVVCIVKLLV